MGEEKKEPEEKKEEQGKEGDKKEGEEKKDEKPEEKKEEEPSVIILKVEMHCEGCARKVKKSLMGFPGVEDVEVDVKAHKVVVKRKAADPADPVKVCERVQKKSGKKTELVSPLPKNEEKKPDENKKEEEKKEEKEKEPTVVTVILKVHMHCEGCAQQVRRVILKMNGVQAAEPDLKNQKVTVNGTMDPLKLVEYVYKKTGKHAEIVPQKEQEGDQKKGDEKKEDADKKDGDDKKEDDKKKEGDSETKGSDDGGGGDDKKAEGKKNESNAPMYVIEYIPPPQIFSDENPNACSVM